MDDRAFRALRRFLIPRYSRAQHGLATLQHYARTTRWVEADGIPLKVGTGCRLRLLTGTDAHRLKEWARTRNVFSRHAGSRDFYYRRACALDNQTVIEIEDSGVTSTRALADLAVFAENLVAASFVLRDSRQRFVRRIIGGKHPHMDLHLFGGSRLLKASSSSQSEQPPAGIKLDDAARSRYAKNGFAAVFELGVGSTELASRVRSAFEWLMASRTDPHDTSALVKTATALETLLVIGKEPPTRTLSERAAYLLSDAPEERKKVNSKMHSFYQIRGELVHGKRVKDSGSISGAVEFGDRMMVLLTLVFGAQTKWTSASDVQIFCDNTRWGHRELCKRPWKGPQIRRAIERMKA